MDSCVRLGDDVATLYSCVPDDVCTGVIEGAVEAGCGGCESAVEVAGVDNEGVVREEEDAE